MSACSLPRESDSPAVVIDRSTSDSVADLATGDDVIQGSPAVSSSAVGRLIELAKQHQNVGEWSQAANALERALRISPRNATLWLQLSEIRYNEKRYRQAESLAQKALQYAGANRTLKRDCWTQIAKSRAATGDRQGADAARRQASQFE